MQPACQADEGARELRTELTVGKNGVWKGSTRTEDESIDGLYAYRMRRKF